MIHILPSISHHSTDQQFVAVTHKETYYTIDNKGIKEENCERTNMMYTTHNLKNIFKIYSANVEMEIHSVHLHFGKKH